MAEETGRPPAQACCPCMLLGNRGQAVHRLDDMLTHSETCIALRSAQLLLRYILTNVGHAKRSATHVQARHVCVGLQHHVACRQCAVKV